MKNIWSIEAKILFEKLEIPAHFKVRFLRLNDKMPRIKNFKALKNGILPQCGFIDKLKLSLLQFQKGFLISCPKIGIGIWCLEGLKSTWFGVSRIVRHVVGAIFENGLTSIIIVCCHECVWYWWPDLMILGQWGYAWCPGGDNEDDWMPPGTKMA